MSGLRPINHNVKKKKDTRAAKRTIFNLGMLATLICHTGGT